MGYVYKITNNINGKSYIGKTEITPEIRFKRHIKEFRKGKDRVLYRAFKKYGIKNFSLETLEECNNGQELCDREIYYIEKYDTFKNGYNSTLGGDGKSYLDYDLIYKTYLECGENLSKTRKLLKISCKDLSRKLGVLGKHTGGEHSRRSVIMYSLDGEKLREFESTSKASEYLRKINNTNSGYYHIGSVCNGRRKQAYGYIWKYKEI